MSILKPAMRIPVFLRTLHTRILALLLGRKFLIGIGSIVAAFILMNYLIMPWYVSHGGTLKVPQVTGMPVAQAMETLNSAGLEPVQAETRPDPQQPAGTVVGQNPDAAAVVKPGRRVYITVSGGEILVSIPPLRGLSVRDAKFRLERNALVSGAINYATSDRYFENTVIDQSLPAGTKVPRGTAVGLLISQGKQLADVTVPDVTGKTIVEAGKLLAGAGLVVGNITYQASDDLLPNTVIDQYPRVGEKAQAGQGIDVFVVRERMQPETRREGD